jgi:heme exporter protein A
MLTVSSLECIRGERRLFSNLNFSVDPGELLLIEGPNGSGKTSLLRIVCGLLSPEQGEIRWRDQTTKELAEDYFKDVLYLGHAAAIKEELSAIENLGIACALAGEPQDLAAIRAALARLGLAGREHLPTKYLSQGQRRRVALSRLLLSRRKLWILDEPFVALDAAAVALLSEIITTHLDGGGVVLLTSHQEVELRAANMRRLRLAA